MLEANWMILRHNSDGNLLKVYTAWITAPTFRNISTH